MFDNLKEKLGSFRKDAEEAAEENVEEVEDDADLEEIDETQIEADADLEADAAESSAESDAANAAEPDAPETAAADDGGAEQQGTPAEATTAGEAVEPAVEPDQAPEADPDLEPAADSEPELEAEDNSGLDLEGMIEDDDGAADTADADADSSGGPDVIADPAFNTDDDDEDDDNGSTGFGRKAKSLVKGKFVIEEEDLEGPLHELELALLSGDVEMGVVDEILDNLRDDLIGETRAFTTSTGDVIEEALRDAIYDVISVGQFDFDERIAIEDKPVTIVFTGVNGVGKTTSIAKMSRYLEERGYSSVMANGDTYRAGANEQIQEHADALDTKCISHEQGGDPAAVLYDAVEYAEANDIDVVLGDTAGRLHTDEGLMDQLEKIDRVVDPDMTLFVDEAVAGQDAVNRAREFNNAAETDGAILTKADADSNGGAAISVAHVTGKPILFLGVGQEYNHLERFDPDDMVNRLLEGEDDA
ncbi:signal recognition particle-docking protein FtsY [Natronolimnobius sp. AArcel1]|uniref:signal recognition particle-docking protein FtsY n=1 Tax=Natronolimnobius sp. AArcel1 TaxID=1679093 RepID=UPI0013ED7D1C|nr:signal recognition particle-docking protein FtsY [Natronolimnobius sp. AArcel1]NGM70076.1 signal recognition particle-docking protein FtsY [Natronolimnobius sp. AArcel1]